MPHGRSVRADLFETTLRTRQVTKLLQCVLDDIAQSLQASLSEAKEKWQMHLTACLPATGNPDAGSEGETIPGESFD
jgi:hypothetical protein